MEENLIKWVKHISEKRDELGGFSVCPFAKKAMEDKKVFWSYINHKHDYFIEEHIISRIHELESAQDIEVVVFYNTDKNLTNADLIRIITKLNNKKEYSG